MNKNVGTKLLGMKKLVYFKVPGHSLWSANLCSIALTLRKPQAMKTAPRLASMATALPATAMTRVVYVSMLKLVPEPTMTNQAPLAAMFFNRPAEIFLRTRLT
ncbi:hypothetical protein DPMN_138243 [Dreissena polymorpha]|uniref:Uncharacterized protein n=1 Tax=Dreissena polymorpha TaxID=45954 RepID=A0A9D4G6Y3_DREPO|nr:hypothetical protein DPMN_039953 [Dreissena polymorpha]KAH3746919.1 hypothetical protein DPMN_181337 [Dreissena polymorpha]KAH3809863.1 hypothetical protein DPMN_138243 [Dreissena polymorpha]